MNSSSPKNEVQKLSSWYEKYHRKLPWRRTHNPYRIWISEVMLQQTQVSTVIPYYKRFLETFPDIESLASAQQSTLLSLWSGLGYYSRAKNLQKGAQFIVEKLSGKFPRDRKTLLSVPGIGPYTAGAILSISFDLPVPIVDGNVQRVFSRYYAIAEPLETSAVQKRLWCLAEDWVNQAQSPRVLNQAIMELGAMVCTKANPSCESCPLNSKCVAYDKSLQDTLPLKKKRTAPKDLWWVPLIYEHKDKIFLKKNTHSRWWQGLWDLPRLELKNHKQLPKTLSQTLQKHRIQNYQPLGETKHTVTHHRIHLYPFRCQLQSQRSLKEDGGKWFSRQEISRLAVSSLVRKALSLSN